VTDERLTTSEALAELKDLLRLASTDEALQRLSATRYTRCREVLLQSELRSALPGFLRQCLTHARFHDFIHLYSHDRNERLAFVEAALKPCENRMGLRSTFDVFGDPDL
jgi:hypothetical protein